MKGFKHTWETSGDYIIKDWYSYRRNKLKEWLERNRPEEYADAKKQADQIKKQADQIKKQKEIERVVDRKKLKKLEDNNITHKINFKPFQYDLQEIYIVKIINFCYKVDVKNTRSGGTKKRKKEDIMYSNLQGKLAELILYDGLPNKDDFNDIDLELYERGEWDHSDLLSKDGRININVKSGLSFHQMLLLTAKDYNERGEYRHHKGSEIVEKELFAFVRLEINKDEITKAFSRSEDDFTKWFLKKYPIIKYDQFFSDICQIRNAIQNGHLIRKDEELNGGTPMDADNYYLLVYNMDQPLETLL
jgi:hypothetical protein